MGDVVGIVLAAGASTRMGQPKLLLPFGETTLLNATIAAVEASRVDRVVVVTGCDAGRVEESIVSNRVTVARNPDYRRGNMSSFLTGVAAAPDGAAFLLVAGDLPTIQVAAVDAVEELWRAARPWAVVAEYEDGVAHPFLLSDLAVEHVRHARGDKVLWHALVDPGDRRVVVVSLPYRAPADVNERTDYERLLDPGDGTQRHR
jgi:molybdenum cofactor cytidylyltransferase